MSLTPSALIVLARQGEVSSLGRLFQLYHNYLRLLADSQLDRKVRGRVSPSDVVQEALLQAHRDFSKFRGVSEREFLGWLRQILLHTLYRTFEQHVKSAKRDVRCEISLEQVSRSVEQSSLRLGSILADGKLRPSQIADRAERSVELANVLAKLSSDYRDVLVLRHFHSKTFEQIGQEMNRTTGAARVLWLRAIRKLREVYEE